MFVIAGDTWAMIAESFPDNTAPPRLAALVDLELVEDGGSNDVREEMISASVTATLSALRDQSLRERPFTLIAPRAWRAMFHQIAAADVRFWAVREVTARADDAEVDAPPEAAFSRVSSLDLIN
jgi:hypothetical protein